MSGKEKIYRLFVAAICIAILSPSLFGQDEREYIRKGNRLYKKSEYAGSEGMYRRAQEDVKTSGDAVFNLGNALYKQKRFGEASGEFIRATQAGEGDSLKQSEGFYNLGNSLLKEQKFSESIDAYINSLKLNPGNIQAKFNLAWAQDQLKKQQEQQQQQQQNQDKQQDENKDNKQDQNKDNQQDKQDQEKKDDQQQQDQQDKQQQQQASMNREDAKRLLDALAASEKQTQEKVQRNKAAGARVRVIKNW